MIVNNDQDADKTPKQYEIVYGWWWYDGDEEYPARPLYLDEQTAFVMNCKPLYRKRVS